MTPTAAVLETGQVWEHRATCRLCKTSKPHQHRYAITNPAPQPGLVIVRDLSVVGNRPEGTRYAMPLKAFGSLGKGGLRLAGRMIGHRFDPLPDSDLDDRLVEHPRISLQGAPRWRGPIPGTDGIAA